MVKWVLIILFVFVAFTAYEKGKDYVDNYGVVGLLQATQKNIVETWEYIVKWCTEAETGLEKEHPNLWCGKQGCEKS